jgi:hypothetical protein
VIAGGGPAGTASGYKPQLRAASLELPPVVAFAANARSGAVTSEDASVVTAFPLSYHAVAIALSGVLP